MTVRRLIISGRVQGVSYRAWFAQQAEKAGINGWVRNRTDGTVEAVIEGDDTALEALITRSHKGPMLARVDKITDIEPDQHSGFTGFEVRPTA